MTKFLVLLLLICASAVVFESCEREEEQDVETFIIGSWTYSFEEGYYDDIKLFRPSDSEAIVRVRFNRVYDFRPNGKCRYLVLAPNDAHYMTDARWVYDENSNVLSIFDLDYELVFKFEVLRIKHDLLIIKLIQ